MAKEKIIFRYNEIETMAGTIDSYATKLEELGEGFVNQLNSDLTNWEGDTKNKVHGLINNGDKSVKQYMKVTMVSHIKELAKLLRSNAEQMKEMDKELAAQLPDSLF